MHNKIERSSEGSREFERLIADGYSERERERESKVNQHRRRTSAEDRERKAGRNWVWSAERRIRQEPEKQLTATSNQTN